MSFIGKPVYKIWAVDALRFGNVTAEKQREGWTYVKIKWKDDEAHEMDVRRVLQYRNIDRDPEKDWHRVRHHPARRIVLHRKYETTN